MLKRLTSEKALSKQKLSRIVLSKLLFLGKKKDAGKAANWPIKTAVAAPLIP